MNLPIFFDIVIGLFFIYLILSLLAAEIQELIATRLQWRAKHLEQSIESLLSGGSEYSLNEHLNEQVEKARNLVKALYNDPLINTLNHEAKERVDKRSQGDNKSIGKGFISERSSAPSYIPSETFASTLLDELKIPHLIKKVQNNPDLKTDLRLILSSYRELRTAIQNKDTESYGKLAETYGDIDEKLENLFKDKESNNVPESLLRSLEVLARRSQNKVGEIDEQVNQLRKEVETWFDRSMDRATGVYKRNAKGVAILIGIAIAILTNTDTFHIISRLSKDTALRTAITTSASQQVALYNNPDIRNQIYKTLGDVSLPLGWTDNNFEQQFGFKPKTDLTKLKFDFGNFLKSLRVVVGWLLSGLAIAMGAPFWFDLLGKVTNVRNAGPRPVSYTKDQPSVSK
ncbi:hypothetical protein Cri9333_3583 [Crinalium epipsammum PCC 9333]|uniref:Uncharacterized protein n=1 Tax=Crinalium epipsammum PCC 9333 TaxID=1173022 RepID=K9W2F4_9CYAN|nr:hypothetical protein [Crinalium epipsammum]AFZ14406.1 hypothetical protein Cri9333_3583 [Crinalium epipsammum PCC 9333]